MDKSSFRNILKAEVHNFKKSQYIYKDIISWGDKLKYICSEKNIKDEPNPREYYELLQISGNSFVTSLLLIAKAHVFFGFAVARIGVEAIINMAIIQSNFKEHLNVWVKYNHTNRNSLKWDKVLKDFKNVFSHNKSKHDYSKFIKPDEKTEIVNRWKMLSNIGSHPSFLQTLMCSKLNDNETNSTITTGLFDVHSTDNDYIGKCLLLLIDTFFLTSKISSRIMIIHNNKLNNNPGQIKDIWNDWCIFKKTKMISFGIIVD